MKYIYWKLEVYWFDITQLSTAMLCVVDQYDVSHIIRYDVSGDFRIAEITQL